MAREIPEPIAERLRVWHYAAHRWHFTGAIIAAVGTLAGLTVTAFTGQIGDIGTRVAGFVAASGTAILTLVNPIRYGNRYRNAWRILDEACLRFSLDANCDISELVAAVKRGEALIGLVEVDNRKNRHMT